MIPRKSSRHHASTAPPKNLQQALKSAEDEFFETLRRPVCAGDRLFYWSYCYSNEEYKRLMIRTMIHAQTPQHLIYIYDKTGFTVNKHGYKRLSKEGKREIKVASIEFDEIERTTDGEVYKLADYSEDGPSLIESPLAHALYIFGNFIERNINSGSYRIDERRFVCGYLLVRAFRLVRAILRSGSFTTSEETLVLVRSLYEIYCKICYARHNKMNAQYLIDSDFGLATGDFEVFQENGRYRRKILIHKLTKKQIPRFRTFYEYISSSPIHEDLELFNPLYDYLSSFVHSGSRHMSKAWGGAKGFSLTDENDEYITAFVSILTTLISSMIMQAILRDQNISHVSKWDMRLFCYVTRKIVADMGAPKGSEIADLMRAAKARSQALPRRVGNFKR